MKVKIGNAIYDAKKEPILFIFENDVERYKTLLNIAQMPDKSGVRKYLVYPDDVYTEDEAKNFMKI